MKKLCNKIAKSRKLHYDKITSDGEYISVRIYFVYNKQKYYFWIDKNIESECWEFNAYIFDITNSKDVFVKTMQENDIFIQSVDYIMDSINKEAVK